MIYMIDVRTSNKLESVVLIPLDNEKPFDMKSVLRRWVPTVFLFIGLFCYLPPAPRMDLFLSLASYSMAPDKDASPFF